MNTKSIKLEKGFVAQIDQDGKKPELKDLSFSQGEAKETEWDIHSSISCGGEKCTVCGKPAKAKIGEEIMHDDTHKNRHNLTAYVCAEHFDMVLRPYKGKPTDSDKEQSNEPLAVEIVDVVRDCIQAEMKFGDMQDRILKLLNQKQCDHNFTSGEESKKYYCFKCGKSMESVSDKGNREEPDGE